MPIRKIKNKLINLNINKYTSNEDICEKFSSHKPKKKEKKKKLIDF